MRESKYTKEFRTSTVQLVLNGNKPTTQIAKDLDLNLKTLYTWIRLHKQENNIQTVLNSPQTTIPKNIIKESLEAENRRLRNELKVAQMERDILKKATAYFAKVRGPQ